MEVDSKAVNAIIFYAAGKKMPEGLDAFVKPAAPKEDMLLTLKGETISGFFEKLSDKDITFNSGGQSRAYPFEQLAAARLAALETYEASKALNATIYVVDGSRLTVKLTGLDEGRLVLESLGGQKFQIGGYEVASIEFNGGRLVYLSSLTPSTVEQKPYVGGVPVVFTWRKDRSVANAPLKIGSTTFDKGIGVHSYCRLVFELNGEYEKFIAEVGMDASAPAKAICSWKVQTDGHEIAAGSATADGEKKLLKLDVAHAKQLELICDYGSDDNDMGDRLDFANARLIKP
jgi:hypothetical protein